jgi:DNA-binding NarL/FixJ family response regulator
MSMRILLADDHRLIRKGLRGLIEKQPDMEVVAEAEDGHAAVRLASEFSPDIVLMDISMPGMDGIEATRQIVAEDPGVKVIALSMHSNRQFVQEMLSAGASGYVLKDCAFEELADAIRAVMAGGRHVSRGVGGGIGG